MIGWRIGVACVLFLVLGCSKKQPTPVSSAKSEAPKAARPRVEHDIFLERVVITEVSILEVDVSPPAEVYAEELGKRLGRKLAASGKFFTSADRAPKGTRPRRAVLEVRLGHSLVDGSKAGRQALLASAEAQFIWLDPGSAIALGEKVLLELATDATVDAGMVAVHVGRAVDTLVPGLVFKETLLRASESDLRDALGSESGDEAIWALEVASERGLKSVHIAGVALLSDERPGVADAAFTALVATGDSQVLGELTRLADFADYEKLRAIVEASVAMGGPEAVAFLEFVASGHPEPTIVVQAREGLEELKRPKPGAR